MRPEMRRYAGLDDKDLVDTHRWKGIEPASRHAQTVAREAARKANALPTPPSGHQRRKTSYYARDPI
jgi:hypothetical protein